MNYRSAVAEMRRLVKQTEVDGWRKAELTHQAVSDGHTKREWAQDTGVSHTQVNRLYSMWERWGGNQVSTRPSYSDAYSAVADNIAGDNVEGAASRRMERDAVSRVQKMDPKRRAEIAQQLLADPEVEEQVEREQASQHTSVAPHAGQIRRDGMRQARDVGERLGQQADEATEYLRGAAREIGNAIFAKDEWGIKRRASYNEVRKRIDQLLLVLDHEVQLNDDDRSFLESIGIGS